MEDFTSPTVPASVAAHAARLPIRRLLYIASCGAFPLCSGTGRPRGGWRAYSTFDVVRLAVAGRLLDCGLTVPQAAYVVAETIDAALAAPLACGLELPPAVIKLRVFGMVAHVVPNGDELPAVKVRRYVVGEAEAALLISIEQIAADALGRLAAAVCAPANA